MCMLCLLAMNKTLYKRNETACNTYNHASYPDMHFCESSFIQKLQDLWYCPQLPMIGEGVLHNLRWPEPSASYVEVHGETAARAGLSLETLATAGLFLEQSHGMIMRVDGHIWLSQHQIPCKSSHVSELSSTFHSSSRQALSCCT